MLFLVDGRFVPDADPEPRMQDERKRVKELKEDGSLVWAYRRSDGGGAVMLLEAAGERELHMALATLPFVQLGIMNVEAEEVESLEFIWS